MKRRGCVQISFEKLSRALNLRPGLDVVAVKGDPMHETVSIILSGDELPETPRKSAVRCFPIAELMDVD